MKIVEFTLQSGHQVNAYTVDRTRTFVHRENESWSISNASGRRLLGDFKSRKKAYSVAYRLFREEL